MGRWVQIVSDYLLIGMLLLVTLLLLAAAIGNLKKPKKRSIFFTKKPSITVLRLLRTDHDARHLLTRPIAKPLNNTDEVIICTQASSSAIRELRLKYRAQSTKIYVPHKIEDTDWLYHQAYKKSKKGNLIVILHAYMNVPDVDMVEIINHIHPGVIVQLFNSTVRYKSPLIFVNLYVNALKMMCRRACALLSGGESHRLGAHAYLRDDFLHIEDKRYYIQHLDICDTEDGPQVFSASFVDITMFVLAVMYGVVGTAAAIVATHTQQIGTLGVIWIATMVILSIVIIGSGSRHDVTAPTLALPLAPLILFATIVTYPIKVIMDRYNRHDAHQ